MTASAGRRPWRIGVVLAGGGAKGAYHVGCWRALERANIGRISAVSGVSVGAMNAVLFASGRTEEAEDIWTHVRWKDVMSLSPRRLHRLPLWILAGLGSEFSPFKVWRLSDTVTHPCPLRRRAYPLACAVAALAAWRLAYAVPYAGVLAAALAACAVLALLHELLRPVFLAAPVTTNAPLAARINRSVTHEDVVRIAARGLPLIGTVSKFRPYIRESVRWGGWAPEYVRLDGLNREALVDQLVQGSKVPGFFTDRGDHARPLDGSWTDNIPAAPLLFDPSHDLDLVFVVYLKHKVRHRPRHNSLMGAIHMVVEERCGARTDGPEHLLEWARSRWEAAGGTMPTGSRPMPRIVQVVPSRRLGNFFTGTAWFSPDHARELVALGEADMTRIIERLGTDGLADPQPVALPRRAFWLRALRRRRDRQAAATLQALS